MPASPNILFIMTDQHRADALGCSGGWVETPHLDELATGGVRFDTCVTTSPMCVPARFALATGLYPHNLGITAHRRATLADTAHTWMSQIRDAGYRTSVFGKTHLHAHLSDVRDHVELMHRHGLDDVEEIAGPRLTVRCASAMTDRWDEVGLYDAFKADFEERARTRPWMVRPSPLGLKWYYDTYVGQRAASYLRDYQAGQPWFCWVSFAGPHEPWDAPEPYASRYENSALPPAGAAPEVPEHIPSVLRTRLEQRPGVTDSEIVALRSNYAGNVTLIDSCIGELFEVIQARGEWDRTVVAFASDHGEMNGDAGLLYKGVLLDPAVRVPLIVSTPGTRDHHGDRVITEPVELSDIGATLAEYADATTEPLGWTRSLRSRIENAASDPVRTDAISAFDNEYALVTDAWKLAVNAAFEPYLLIDRTVDPAESRNLVEDPAYADEVQDLVAQLHCRLDTTVGDESHHVRIEQRGPAKKPAQPKSRGSISSRIARRFMR